MDPPPYAHHSRYAPISSPNPNFYSPPVYHHHHHHHHHHIQLPPPPPPPTQLLPPPLPPPPPPPLLRGHPLPPPPPPPRTSYNSHISQFTFNPNPNLNPNPKPDNYHHHRHHPPIIHDFSHRIPIEDDRHHFHRHPLPPELESRPNSWDPRIVPEHRPLNNGLEHHQQLTHHPVFLDRSIDKLSHDLEAKYRFSRERYNSVDFAASEHNNSYSNHRAEMAPYRSQFLFDSERLNLGNYSNLHGSRFDDNELMRGNLRDEVLDRQGLIIREGDAGDSLRDGVLNRWALREIERDARDLLRDEVLDRREVRVRERDACDLLRDEVPDRRYLRVRERDACDLLRDEVLDRWDPRVRERPDHDLLRDEVPDRRALRIRERDACDSLGNEVLDRMALRIRERDARDSLIEIESINENCGYGVREFNRKRKNYWSDLETCGSSREIRENSYDYNRTPWKQIQKKSAFLRIQRPLYWNRDDEELHYSGNFNEINLDHTVDEKEERTGSPMELDVSFKSNSLVAKAIVAPSTSAVVCDANITPNSGKIRKLELSGKDSSSSQMNKHCDSDIKFDSSGDVNDTLISGDKDLKQNGKEVCPSVIHDLHDDSSQPCSNGVNDSLLQFRGAGSKGIVLDARSTDVGTSKTSLLTVAKKKRVVKLKHSDKHVPSLQPKEKVDELVKKVGSTLDAPAASVPEKGKNLFKENVGGSPQAARVSNEVNIDVDSGSSRVTKIKRKWNNSTSPLASSCHKKTKTDDRPTNADNSIHVLPTILNTDKHLTTSLNETSASDIGSVEGVGLQGCQNRDSLLHKNSATNSPEILVSVGRCINSDLLSFEEKKRHEDHVDTCSSAHWTSPATNFNDGLVTLQEKSSNQLVSSAESNTVEGIPLSLLPERTSKISAWSCSEKNGIHNVFVHSDCSNSDRGSDNACINSEEIKIGTSCYVSKQLSLEGITSSIENDSTEGIPDALYPAEGNEENMPNSANNSKVTTSLALPNGTVTDMYMGPINAVSSAHCVDTTSSLPVKDLNPPEATITSTLDVSIQPCADAVTVSHESNVTCGFSKAKVSVKSGLVGTSPEKSKRRKLSNFHPGFTNAMLSETSEGSAATEHSMSVVETPSNCNEGQLQPEQQTEVFKMDSLCTSNLLNSPDISQVPYEDMLEQVSSEVVVPVGRVAFLDETDGLKIDQQRANSENYDIPKTTSGFPSENRGEQVANVLPFLTRANDNNEDMHTGSKKEEKMNSVAGEDQVKTCSASQLKTPLRHPQRLPGTYVGSNRYHLEKDDLPSISTYIALPAHGGGVSTTNSNDERDSDNISDIGSPEILSSVTFMQSLTCKASPSQISNKVVCEDEKMPNENPVIDSASNLSTSPQYLNIDLKSKYESPHLVAARAGLLTSQDVKSTSHNLNSKSGETYWKKNHPSHAVSRTYPIRPPFAFTSSKNSASSTYSTKPLTWHRLDKSSASPMPGKKPFSHAALKQSQFPKKVAKFQSTSYIRKGNSLVRKPASVAALPQVSHALPSSVYRLNALGIGELKKRSGSDSRFDDFDMPISLRTGGVGTAVERPKTPPLPTVSRVESCVTKSSGDGTSCTLTGPLPNSCSDTTSDPQKIKESSSVPNSSSDTLKISETPVNQTASVNHSEGQCEPNDRTLATSTVKKVTYVKRKSNQLVAASNHYGLPVQNADKTQGFLSDGYYKRRKNQLIRSSVESHINQTITLPDDILLSEGKAAQNDSFSRNYSKKQSYKVVTKIRRPARFSLVWTPSNMQSRKNNDQASCSQKALPYLIPWKRAGYLRYFMQNSASASNNSSLSAISRKLLLMRKRDAVYTRSGRGFSLRKSKVLSVGGSSLKWSKSIEKRSKIANEEATLAVAAVGRKKSGQNGAESIAFGTKNRRHSSRERIFRIGSVRYKMDSSRRTLQRIPDNELPNSAATNSDKNVKKSYIPRRLVIGNNEYVSIGNGNKLVRNPKKWSRVLASEKVRWSLHTARLRLARKRKYCQFFTRFGKCNKNDGKCPYIHDPSKIAVCTKFLNGLCSNSSCKFTHKVIPERMPDCSYFLQGSCTKTSCPYRHVQVDPNSSTCEEFLKGYCPDGNECRKKHSYVCPIFEATGSCPEGSKCKLHHPKSEKKGKKSKRSREQKNSRGRYFGSLCTDDSEPPIVISGKQSEQGDSDAIIEGKFAEYIGLDTSGDEGGENSEAMNEQTASSDSENSDLDLDDLDLLV